MKEKTIGCRSPTQPINNLFFRRPPVDIPFLSALLALLWASRDGGRLGDIITFDVTAYLWFYYLLFTMGSGT